MAARCALLLLPLLLAPAAAAAGVTASGRFFKDAGGRTLIFRGVNVAADAKLPNFRPVADPAAAFASFPARGVTAARVLFTWEAYEPEPGVYDDSYLAYVKSLVRALAAVNVSSIIDMHQDAYARSLAKGCGDGFPAWAVSPRAAALATGPVNTNTTTGARCAAWQVAALIDVPTNAAWADFYADAAGARTAFVNVWGRVAAAFAGEVIGYDILNEPGTGGSPLSELIDIAPLYADAARAIRAADPTAILFFGAGLASATGAPTLLPDPGIPNVALEVHFYPLPGTPTEVALAEAAAALVGWSEHAKKWDAPLFVGEYGAQPSADVPPLISAERYVRDFTALLNKALISGTQWAWAAAWTPTTGDGWNAESFSVVDDKGARRANWPAVPYPAATAGTPTTFAADSKKGSVLFEWDGDAAVTPQTTRVYAPAAEFFNVGVPDVVFDVQPPTLSCAYDAGGAYIECGLCAGACVLVARRR